MMKQFATKLAPYAIRANVIAPGCKSTLDGNWILESWELYSRMGCQLQH
jgi:NAD(P)-dependent dehydrogenase (short-subunit alcohol dehydrogenase family)